MRANNTGAHIYKVYNIVDEKVTLLTDRFSIETPWTDQKPNTDYRSFWQHQRSGP